MSKSVKPYRVTKIVIPGWEANDQRAYLVVDRKTGQPLGRVADLRLWNVYDPNDEHWSIAHSDSELSGTSYSTMKGAVRKIWIEHKVIEAGPDFPPLNLKYAQNFEYGSEEDSQSSDDLYPVEYRGQYFGFEKSNEGLTLVCADAPEKINGSIEDETTKVLTLMANGIMRHGDGVPPGFEQEESRVGSVINDLGPR